MTQQTEDEDAYAPRSVGPKQIPIEIVRHLKMSFVSIEEIERLKKDSNMYKSTQRNQLGVAKNTGSDPKKNVSSSRLNWIDLFNIGNVMLMRGQDIQVSH
jgi:hypothetical protein